MAATTGGALKQIIESLGLGLSSYRDVAPADAALPYCIAVDEITVQTVAGGDGGSGDTVIENVQLDLYQLAINLDTNRVAEDPTLAGALHRSLQGWNGAVNVAGVHIYGIRIPFRSRARLADDNTVRTRFSVDIYRSL